jgi:hypothetical protein
MQNVWNTNAFAVLDGDKSGWLHLGPQQELTAELPRDSPELQFSIKSYPGSLMTADSTLTVHNVTLDIQGILSGVNTLIIGPYGDVILRSVVVALL